MTVRSTRGCWIGLALVALVWSGTAHALTSPSLRDLADPVPPGGILTYRIALSDATPPAPEPPFCFKPPAECMLVPVTCDNPPPSCTGNETAGFVCQDSFNDGADCGVGSPPAPDPSLCIARASGVCNGGNNVGLRCTVPHGQLTPECPGSTFQCVRAYNDGDYCGHVPEPACVGNETTGFFCDDSANDGESCATTDVPPQPDPDVCQPRATPRPVNSFCLDQPTGICSGGPNFLLECTAAHEEPTDECPPETTPLPPSNITVDLPIPSGTSFIDADNGGTSNGTMVTWNVPPLSSCGVPGTPQCPRLHTRLLVDPLVPEGTVLENQATATDQDGFLTSSIHKTTIAQFLLRGLIIAYPAADGRDRVSYRAKLTLRPTESIDPATEGLRFEVRTTGAIIAEFTLAPGEMRQSSAQAVTYRGGGSGLRRVVIRQRGPAHYAIRVRAAQLDLPEPPDLNGIVTLEIGDDVFVHQVPLLVKRNGRRYVGSKQTTTTTTLFTPTTTSTTVTTSTLVVTTTSVTSTSSTLLGTTTSTSTLLPSSTTSTSTLLPSSTTSTSTLLPSSTTSTSTLLPSSTTSTSTLLPSSTTSTSTVSPSTTTTTL